MKRVSHSLFLTSMVLMLGLGWAMPASAHAAVVTGEVVCLPDGRQQITWTVTNDQTTAGTNRPMLIDSLTIDQGTVSGIAAGDTVAPQDLAVPGSGTATGTTKLAGTTTGLVTLSLTVSWRDPATGQPAGPQNQPQSGSVTLTGGCEAPVNPSASIADADCAKGGAELTFRNSGGGTASFEVFKNDQLAPIATVMVTSAEAMKTQLFPLIEDETAIFRITSTGMETISKTVSLNCVRPAAAVELECVIPFGAKVSASNTGQLPVTFKVSKNGLEIDSFSAEPGVPVVRKYDIPDDQTATFVVAGGGLSQTATLTNNCLEVLGLKAKRGAVAANTASAGGPGVAGESLPATGPHTLAQVIVALSMVAVGWLILHPAARPAPGSGG